MFDNSKNIESSQNEQKQFQMMKQCPSCTGDYQDSDISIIDHRKSSRTIHLSCSKCKNSMIAMIGPTNMGMALVGLITDLTREDAQRAKSRLPLTDDQLLENYNYIHNHSEKFIKLFN